ncbi:Uu.00g084440.m01.CDS01 [Anthostomella pinea]|uniref:Uu.00g084440.m01.CDS01 n=1 Tax=Anthostomella pinea TaxID=933095 RepID=A0AAI8VLU5_9PEZI|nr:Uu.00g084440.m01.CDS01 [Anthostomella pinea]
METLDGEKEITTWIYRESFGFQERAVRNGVIMEGLNVRTRGPFGVQRAFEDNPNHGNYRGNPNSTANQSANIGEHDSTPVYVTNLPPDCDVKKLLASSRSNPQAMAGIWIYRDPFGFRDRIVRDGVIMEHLPARTRGPVGVQFVPFETPLQQAMHHPRSLSITATEATPQDDSEAAGKESVVPQTSNYQGNPDNPANQSADIPYEQSTSVYIINLPPDCTVRMLLATIRGKGKVYRCNVTAPSGTHRTAAAKIVFWNRIAVDRLFEQLQKGEWLVAAAALSCASTELRRNSSHGQ